jgi:hypothetical protein
LAVSKPYFISKISNLFYMRFLRWLPAIIAIGAFGWLCFGLHSHYQIAPIGALGTYACRNLQARLVDYFGRNISVYRTGGSTAFIKWLLSPQNTRGFNRIDVESIPGKKRAVAFRVDLPYCFSLCALNVDCRSQNISYLDTSSGEMVFDLTNPPYRHCDVNGNPVRLRFSEDDLAKYCTETDQSYIDNKVAQYLLEFEQGLDKVLTTTLNAQVGTDAAGNAIKNLPLFVQGNQFTPGMTVLNPDAVWYMDQAYKDIALEGQYALIGGTIVSKLADAKKWAAGNAAGVDLSKYDSGNPIPFYDRNFNTTFGQSDIITLAPGVTQLVTWNKYRGEKRRAVTNLYSKGTVILPTTGLEIDWKWWYDYDCEEWLFEAFLYGELATVPAGGCAAVGAGAATVNGIMRFHECGGTVLIPTC